MSKKQSRLKLRPWMNLRLEQLNAYINSKGVSKEEKELILERQAGRTTGVLFEYIGKALQNPEVIYKVVDHAAHHHADKLAFVRLKSLVERANLQGFRFYNDGSNRFVFSLKPIDESTEWN